MPIDTRMVAWDSEPKAPDPRMVAWDDAKPTISSVADDAMKRVRDYSPRDLLSGLGRGFGSIGATLLSPIDAAALAINSGKPINIGGYDIAGQDRRAIMDDVLHGSGADLSSVPYGMGKIGGEIAGTAGVGTMLGLGLRAAPIVAKALPTLIPAIESGGVVANGTKGLYGQAARVAGGTVTGAAMSGLVDPEYGTAGGVIGAFTPGALQLAGKFGGAVLRAVRGNKADAGKLLAEALNVSEAELPRILKALQNAPESIVPGSTLTVNQALQQQGASTPGSKLLERIISGGPGGDVLLNRYADQGAARMAALESQGAQTYQGAAREEATRAGDKIGAILRTQAGDDKMAARKAWEAVYGRAAIDGVNLRLPLDEMNAAMAPLGRGTVGAGNDARSILSEAQNIGTEAMPSIKAVPQSAGTAQTLEQAVRSAGGIRSGNALSGELGDLRIKGSGTTGLVMQNGKPADLLAEMMHQRGFIPDSDPATLFEALRNGGGRKLFANDAPDAIYQRAREAAMGDMPAAEAVPKAVPFDEFQRLRRSAGALGAKVGSRAGGETEAGVLGHLQQLMTKRADDAANGVQMLGDNITPEFLSQYNSARSMTRANADRYKGGNNIASILRKPIGQDFTLTGDEVINKLWHGGAGLAGDVSNLKGVLSDTNQGPTLDALRKFIMTDAASKTAASGDLGAALPRYVENRMPGLLEALNPDQLRAVTSVAADIRNQDAANAVKGLLGSDTHAKISRSLDAGLLDSPIAKTISKVLAIKGVGAESLRAKMSENVIQYKGKTLADLLANPKAAAQALQDSGFVKTLDDGAIKGLRLAVSRAVPATVRMLQQETQ